jgi:hypothetical protein
MTLLSAEMLRKTRVATPLLKSFSTSKYAGVVLETRGCTWSVHICSSICASVVFTNEKGGCIVWLRAQNTDCPEFYLVEAVVAVKNKCTVVEECTTSERLLITCGCYLGGSVRCAAIYIVQR